MDRIKNDWFGREGSGAPNKDQSGNIVATRKRPLNPNKMSVDWFTGGTAALTPQQQMEAMRMLGMQQQPQTMQQYPQSYQPPQQQNNFQNQIPNDNQSLLSVNYQGENYSNRSPVPNINIIPAPQASIDQRRNTSPGYQEYDRGAQPQNMMPEPNLPNLNAEIIDKLKKRQRALELQKQQLEQIETKKRGKQHAKLQEKRLREVQEQRIIRERDDKQKRMMMDYASGKTKGFNLHETNFDVKTFQKSFYTQNPRNNESKTLMTTATDLKSKSKRPRTPIDEVEEGNRKLKEERERIIIEQRVIKELPIQITMQV